jgi:hypothetical protein
VGSRAVLDAVVMSKILSPRRESNPQNQLKEQGLLETVRMVNK